MEKKLFNYLILPKGIQSILFKSYTYFVPFLFILNSSPNYLESFLFFLILFFLFEFLINPSRYQLNDVIDYKDDNKRKFHWTRPVNQDTKNVVLLMCLLRFIFGTIIAFFINIKLGFLAIVFFVLQVFYDFFVRKNSAFWAILIIGITYPLRSLVIFYGFNIQINQTICLILISIFLYSTYMVIQWRKSESFFILNYNLKSKPKSSSFLKPKINFFLYIILVTFLFSFSLLMIYLFKIPHSQTLIIWFTSSSLIILFSVFNKKVIKIITKQSHNILIMFLFLIILNNNLITSISIITIVILVTFWYHYIYIKEFSKVYFKKQHYEKK